MQELAKLLGGLRCEGDGGYPREHPEVRTFPSRVRAPNWLRLPPVAFRHTIERRDLRWCLGCVVAQPLIPVWVGPPKHVNRTDRRVAHSRLAHTCSLPDSSARRQASL